MDDHFKAHLTKSFDRIMRQNVLSDSDVLRVLALASLVLAYDEPQASQMFKELQTKMGEARWDRLIEVWPQFDRPDALRSK